LCCTRNLNKRGFFVWFAWEQPHPECDLIEMLDLYIRVTHEADQLLVGDLNTKRVEDALEGGDRQLRVAKDPVHPGDHEPGLFLTPEPDLTVTELMGTTKQFSRLDTHDPSLPPAGDLVRAISRVVLEFPHKFRIRR